MKGVGAKPVTVTLPTSTSTPIPISIPGTPKCYHDLTFHSLKSLPTNLFCFVNIVVFLMSYPHHPHPHCGLIFGGCIEIEASLISFTEIS